jgi:hypothetical protein
MDDPSESDVSTEVNSLKFIAEQDFLTKYGENFIIALNENQGFSVMQKGV